MNSFPLWRLLAAVVLACVLVACGSDGSNGHNGTAGADGISALISVLPEPPGLNCVSGGTRVDTGQDSNANGLLDSAEIGGTQYICSGLGNSLVATTQEPVGINCSDGGQKFSAGRDANGNGVLDASEVSSTGYACNGTHGTNGVNFLLAITPESVGANCAQGGVKVNSGPDANGNGTLDATEVASTQYVCNGLSGVDGHSALVNTTNEPAGANCPYGGTRISAGVDANGNGGLDGAEISATSYACNGAPGAGIVWNEVNGAAAQMVAGTGYMVTSDVQAVLTLPIAPAIGSIVQVSGLGRGGWRIAQNAGQRIITSNVRGGRLGEVITARENARDWRAVASSADGLRLTAAASNDRIYTSSDGGATWIARESGDNGVHNPNPQSWNALATSESGTRQVAAATGAHLYVLDDTFLSPSLWTARDSVRDWSGVACSADGMRMVAVARGDQIFTSTNGGRNWAPHESARNWIAAASSADGSKLVAAEDGGLIYTSADGGGTWTSHESARAWRHLASSADGTKLIAAVFGGQIYTSNDSGNTWVPHLTDSDWFAVSSSADGTRLYAGTVSPAPLFFSTDSGATWAMTNTTGVWVDVASSADGLQVIGANNLNPLLTLETVPTDHTTAGVAGSITGGQHDAIALQYAGGGEFVPLSYSGSFAVN